MMEKELSSCRVAILRGRAAWGGVRGHDRTLCAWGLEGRRVTVMYTRGSSVQFSCSVASSSL